MEKEQLVRELTKIVSSLDLSVDLFFVFKSSDVYVQYLADPDDTLRERLITEFVSGLEIYTEENNEYELKNIYDDNESEDYHLFYDGLVNNPIATSIFNFDRANVLAYTEGAGALSKIYGFLIEISNGADKVSLYKRNQPTNAINPRNVINFFTGTNNKLTLIQYNSIFINKKIELFKINDTILINSRSVYEHQFGFIAELKSKAETGYINLTSIEAFEFNENLQDRIKKFSKSELKKLCNLTKDNPIIASNNWNAVKAQAKKYANHKFEVKEDGTIKISTQKELKILISILNRDFNHNEASKEKFLTKNKKLIK